MNDFWSLTPAEFRKNIEGAMSEIRKTRPRVEFVLVTSIKFDPAYTSDPTYVSNLEGYAKELRSMQGQESRSVGDIDDEFAHRAMDNFGAFILGRNMFGPVRGPWLDDSWKGWWGDNPPYHAPTFVLTHHGREPLVMEGGTTFYFVTGGIGEALERAKQHRLERQRCFTDFVEE